MNREIRFRAWDKRERKMWTPIIDQDGVPCALHPITRQLIRMDGDLLDPVMQYTGLQDADGMQIYEGDIVTAGDDLKCVVTWKRSGWTAAWKREIRGAGVHTSYPELGFRKHRVIGNVHEHPELLEDA